MCLCHYRIQGVLLPVWSQAEWQDWSPGPDNSDAMPWIKPYSIWGTTTPAKPQHRYSRPTVSPVSPISPVWPALQFFQHPQQWYTDVYMDKISLIQFSSIEPVYYLKNSLDFARHIGILFICHLNNVKTLCEIILWPGSTKSRHRRLLWLPNQSKLSKLVVVRKWGRRQF